MQMQTTQRVETALRRINPNEPGGDWSVYDLMQALNLSEGEVRSALDALYPLHGGGRYVGGVSRNLYSITR